MTSGVPQSDRLEVHNCSVDEAAASAGNCALTHLASGRVCDLPARHAGPCNFAQR